MQTNIVTMCGSLCTILVYDQDDDDYQSHLSSVGKWQHTCKFWDLV